MKLLHKLFTMMEEHMIYLTGDVHGAYNIRQKLESYIFPEGQKMTKNDVVIICGDFGIPWSYPTDERFSSDIEYYINGEWVI